MSMDWHVIREEKIKGCPETTWRRTAEKELNPYIRPGTKSGEWHKIVHTGERLERVFVSFSFLNQTSLFHLSTTVVTGIKIFTVYSNTNLAQCFQCLMEEKEFDWWQTSHHHRQS